jgi:hypothetical protein
LNPRICEVDAVGIGANNNELRNPICFILFFISFQSYLVSVSAGLTPHKSNCNSPLLAGEPSNVS